jgi:uncharacterized protein (DUF2164 family)
MTIRLSDDAHKQALKSIRAYFEERFEDEIGDLQAQLLLDFFLEELAPSVYNCAIADAQKFIQERVVDIDATCFEPEFGYWKKTRK